MPRCFSDPAGESYDIAEDATGTLLLAPRQPMRFLAPNGKVGDHLMRVAGKKVEAACFLRDREDGLWIGTAAQGLVHIHEGRVDTFTKNDGLSSNDIASIYEDREGSIWVTTFDGLDRFRKLAIPSITSRQGLSSDHITSVLNDRDGSIWIGTYDGLNRLRENKLEVFGQHRELPQDNVFSLFQTSKGRLLVNSNGLAWLENGRIIPISAAGREDIFAIVEDSRGDLWPLSHNDGLIHLSSSGSLLQSSRRRHSTSLPADLRMIQGGTAYGYPREMGSLASSRMEKL